MKSISIDHDRGTRQGRKKRRDISAFNKVTDPLPKEPQNLILISAYPSAIGSTVYYNALNMCSTLHNVPQTVNGIVTLM